MYIFPNFGFFLLRFLLDEHGNKRARSLKSVVTDQPQTSDKIVIESVVDAEKAFDSKEWPFAPLCEDLCRDLFKYGAFDITCDITN